MRGQGVHPLLENKERSGVHLPIGLAESFEVRGSLEEWGAGAGCLHRVGSGR